MPRIWKCLFNFLLFSPKKPNVVIVISELAVNTEAEYYSLMFYQLYIVMSLSKGKKQDFAIYVIYSYSQ
jgi:hypothetical protein